MTTPREEYLKRRTGTSLLPLSDLHHYVMDRVFSEFSDGFSFDDVLQIAVNDPEIVNSNSMAGNINRVKLVVIRALEGLIAVGMLKESTSLRGVYYFCWPETS